MMLSVPRLILAGGFALAVAAAPAVAVFAVPAPSTAPLAQQSCAGGEEADAFTGVCVPHTVPNAGSPFSTEPGNPDVPVVMGGIPCLGHNSGQCIGLAEEQQAMTVSPPNSPVISHSPTVTG